MGLLKRQFDLAKEVDRREVLEVLRPTKINLKESHLSFALDHLSGDWFKLNSLDYCTLATGRSNCGIDLLRWARTLQALYEFRNQPGIKEQMRRLCIRSHERLDTILVMRVAMRYRQRGFDVEFEPNGKGSSDLLLVRDTRRVFAEVKRENTDDHWRLSRMRSVGSRLSHDLSELLGQRLDASDSRIEIKFSYLFSDGQIQKIIDEVEGKSQAMPFSVETKLDSTRGASMILMPRKSDAYYKKGMHSAIVRVGPERAIQITAPENMLVRCTFDMRLNLQALGNRIRIAGEQLKRDLAKDPNSRGLIVLETDYGGEQACDAIEKRFLQRVPQRCLGITLLSDSSFVVSSDSLNDSDIEIMTFAATDGDDGDRGSGHAESQLFIQIEANR